jgi:hypothetical protein
MLVRPEQKGAANSRSKVSARISASVRVGQLRVHPRRLPARRTVPPAHGQRRALRRSRAVVVPRFSIAAPMSRPTGKRRLTWTRRLRLQTNLRRCARKSGADSEITLATVSAVEEQSCYSKNVDPYGAGVRAVSHIKEIFSRTLLFILRRRW